jgi:hypothetical protein
VPRLLLVLLLALATTGCHARLRAAAPGIESIVAETSARDRPFVSLGYGNSPFLQWMSAGGVNQQFAIADVVVQIVEAVHEAKLKPHISDAVAVAELAPTLREHLVEEFDDSELFTHGPSESPAVLQVEIRRFGMWVPRVGGRGEFQVVARSRLLSAEGKRPYQGRAVCGFHDPELTGNSAKVLQSMDPDQVHEGVLRAAEACGATVVQKLVRAATPPRDRVGATRAGRGPHRVAAARR